MKILPINNIQNNNRTKFKAKFGSKDIKVFLSEIKHCDMDDVPKLYTMLDIIKFQSGTSANIKNYGIWCQIEIDGKSLNNEHKYINAYHALHDATVNHRNTLLKTTPIKRLSEEEFEEKWLGNSKKTIQDIEGMFE